jgi:hypothetical protein
MSKVLKFDGDGRRKHHHFLVSVFYADSETFGRVYTDKDRAEKLAACQKKSPVVQRVQVKLLS